MATVEKALSQPTWAVASLLPAGATVSELPKISSKQLHHLLRLAALPPPKNQVEEDNMLQTLSSQLQFVNAIQNVDTTDVEPLQSLRDETAEGRKEAEITVETLKDALAQEEVVGQYHQRIRRRRHQLPASQYQKWDVLGHAERRVGRFFVVQGDKD
ncbi:hypothetical protein AMS68_003294 [Peltaster fructicola]|uniref:Glutamyl-tRNA amidotransferase complex subunit Gta3 domain-containing protein n=1 Tax=Peltaster fructicola TaxID=286661 RepID=A0A6H0XSN8_9PEZI|nr:hypothetical protein AMS68_003294 [Peltaster fructicola]